MTSSSATLAAAHAAAHSAIPSPLTIVLAVAAVGYVIWSRMKGQPLKAKRLLVLPVVLTILGITDLTGSSAPHLTAKDIGFLAVAVGLAAVLGAARGATIELYPHGGELWQRYRPATVALWITLIAAKLILLVIAGAAHASAGGGTNSLLLALGVSLLAEAAIVGPRALSTGLPFAAGHQDSGRPGPVPPVARQRIPTTTWPPQEPAASRPGEPPDPPASPASRGARGNSRPWRSPSLSDGLSWARQQAGQPAGTSGSQDAPSPGPAGYGRGSHDDHHHDHHDHHRGRTGPS
jgi:hypothetical protein